MSTTDCLIDGRRVADGARLCRSCTAALARDLEAVPDIAADLLITVSRQDHVQPARSGRGGGSPLAFNAGASEELADLRYYLGSWARCMSEDLGIALDVDDTAPSCASWLLRHLRLIRHHDAVDDLTEEIGQAVRDARRATDVPPVSSRFVVGPCPEIITDDRGVAAFCDGDVLATITTTGAEPPTMTCLRHGKVWPPETWLRAGKKIANRRDELGWRPTNRRAAAGA